MHQVFVPSLRHFHYIFIRFMPTKGIRYVCCGWYVPDKPGIACLPATWDCERIGIVSRVQSRHLEQWCNIVRNDIFISFTPSISLLLYRLYFILAFISRFNITTGKYPFEGDNIFKLFEKIGEGVFQVPEEVDPLLGDLLQGMLHKDPYQRFTLPLVRYHR